MIPLGPGPRPRHVPRRLRPAVPDPPDRPRLRARPDADRDAHHRRPAATSRAARSPSRSCRCSTPRSIVAWFLAARTVQRAGGGADGGRARCCIRATGSSSTSCRRTRSSPRRSPAGRCWSCGAARAEHAWLRVGRCRRRRSGARPAGEPGAARVRAAPAAARALVARARIGAGAFIVPALILMSPSASSSAAASCSALSRSSSRRSGRCSAPTWPRPDRRRRDPEVVAGVGHGQARPRSDRERRVLRRGAAVFGGLMPWVLAGWEVDDDFPLPSPRVRRASRAAGAVFVVSTFARFVIEGLGTPPPSPRPSTSSSAASTASCVTRCTSRC